MSGKDYTSLLISRQLWQEGLTSNMAHILGDRHTSTSGQELVHMGIYHQRTSEPPWVTV